MEKNPTMLFVVAAALVNQVNEILVQKRPEGKPMAGLWEFPGGKVEQNENPESALVRELHEELGITIHSEKMMPLTFASEALGEKNLLLLLYICREWDGEAQAMEGNSLRWVTIAEMRGLSMPPADGPFIGHLARMLNDGAA
ncbi:8-oxo-dGTP diphosphatase MutT [Sphingorhabdus arenilitoris]|uniref:8-oxo-dGTP diphosphatase n=1 Tax=Sphingorhabdus arenilitoris TaxID=1490041 RepID=A0ABV8RHZ8_9SPHN